MPGYEAPKGVPTVFDDSYKGCGQRVGVEIWRVEKLKVVKKGPDNKAYEGQFHTGDSYIILQTRQPNNAFERDIFFWLGTESSQDEMGIAAYKTVELDESLGGEPVQHREVQGHETDEFLSMFKKGVRYLEGGVATGFKKVDREAFQTRLLHIKGRRNIRTQQVPLEPKSMNEGDVFILDAGRNIFQWNGKSASRVEKSKGLEVTKQVRDQERGGNAKIHIIDSGKDDDTLFWEKFGVAKPSKISAESDDEAHQQAQAANMKLYRVSDASGKLNIEEVEARPLTQELLATEDAFILDTGSSGIFAWVGKGASKAEKCASMQNATNFISQKGYPNWTSVTRVVEGAETPMFKQNFQNWKEANALLPGQTGTRKPTFVKKTFDTKTMQKKAAREAARLVDDGKGELEVWRIEDREMAVWPKEKYGHFYGGDSYILLYTYLRNSKECRIIYFWQGHKSSQDEKAASAIHTVALDDKYGGEPVQVRVVQNKEPPHLYLVMKHYGGMVVHEGGRASGFKNTEEQDSYDTDGTRLFQIRGTNDYNTRAIQVPEKATSLNSGDVFCLETPGNMWLWMGRGCTGDEREFAKQIMKGIDPRRGANYEAITEGQEPEAFWESLGGQAPYADVKEPVSEDYHEPRLFQCSNNRGYFYAEEIFDYDQADLIEEDVMLLDTYFEVFVWIGNDANVEEKKKALETAIEYVKGDTSGRTVDDTVMMQIKQGFEPPNFTAHFFAWDPEKWSNGMSYEDMKAALDGTGDGSGPELGGGDLGGSSITAALEDYSDSRKFPYADLKNNANLPETVDKTRKEVYLSDEEFQQVFKVAREDFSALPKWKQSTLKKKAGLF